MTEIPVNPAGPAETQETEAAPEEQLKTEQIKPSDTLEFWKAQSRRHEARAKENLEATKRLQAFEDAQKSETEKLNDNNARLEAELSRFKTESVRYRIASENQIPSDYLDLLGTGDEEAMLERAKKISELVANKAAANEAAAAAKPPTNGRPTANLAPGASPEVKSDQDGLYESIFGPAK
jgi:hypothetical protein